MRKIIIFILLLLAAIMILCLADDSDDGFNPYYSKKRVCKRHKKYFGIQGMTALEFQSTCKFKSNGPLSECLDKTRNHLYKFFRMQSAQLVQGTCVRCHNIYYNNIFLMRQNWYLEYSARFLFEKYGCPFKLGRRVQSHDFPPHGKENIGTLPDISVSDYYFAVTSIKIESAMGQEEVVLALIQIMKEKDVLSTWNKTDYQLGSASHYGCSIIIKDHVNGISAQDDVLTNDRAAYLACLFLAYVRLVSHRGKLTEKTCILSNGYARYFSSVEVTLCLHINLALNPTGKLYDIACEESNDYNRKFDKIRSTTVYNTKTQPIFIRTTKEIGETKTDTSTIETTMRTSMETSAMKKQAVVLQKFTEIQEYDEENMSDSDRNINGDKNGLPLFLLAAVTLFCVLVMMVSIYEYRT